MLSNRGTHSVLRGGMSIHGRASCKSSSPQPTLQHPTRRIRQFSAVCLASARSTHPPSSTSHLHRHGPLDTRIRPAHLSQIRFRSSTPTAIPTDPPPFLPDDPLPPDPSDSIPAAPPAEIGYLREHYDLDFGWGPTTMMQHIFEHIHVSLGAEYWVSITLMAGLLRLCMFPLQARASDNSAKMASIASVTKPLQERAKVAREKQDQAEGKRANGTLGVVYKQAGVNLWTNLLPMLQLPLGFGLWRLFRNMGDMAVAGLETGGPLFHIPLLGEMGLENLLVPGPIYIPLLVAGINFATTRLSTKERTLTNSEAAQRVQNFMLYGLPFISLFITYYQPGIVQLFFLNTSVLAFASGWLLQRDRFRAWYGITPKVRAADPQTPAPGARKHAPGYAGTMTKRAAPRTHADPTAPARRPMPAAPSSPHRLLHRAGGAFPVFERVRIGLEDANVPFFRSREEQGRREEERMKRGVEKERREYERAAQGEIERGRRREGGKRRGRGRG